MLDLLANYTILDLAIFIGVICVVISSIYSLYKNSRSEFGTFMNSRMNRQKEREEFTEALKKLNSIEATVNVLRESDKSRIKGEILREHAEHTALGHIDARTMEYLEQQYACYVRENGNSFVEGLMAELRKLYCEAGQNKVINPQ